MIDDPAIKRFDFLPINARFFDQTTSRWYVKVSEHKARLSGGEVVEFAPGHPVRFL